MEFLRNLHVQRGDTGEAHTVAPQGRPAFEVVDIGSGSGKCSFFCSDADPEDLDNIARAFTDAAQLMRERRISEAAQVPEAEL